MQAYTVVFKTSKNGKSKEGIFEMIMVSDDNHVANASNIDNNHKYIVLFLTRSFNLHICIIHH